MARANVKPCTNTSKDCVSDVAALMVAVPNCEATMLQVPAASNVADVPLTVHTVGVVELYVIGNPEVALAVNVIDAPTAWLAIGLKMMVCGAGTTKVSVLELAILPAVPFTVIV